MKLLVLLKCLAVVLTTSAKEQNLNVQVTTWNANKKLPPDNLTDLLNLQRDPDLWAVGLQEVNNPKDEGPLPDLQLKWKEAVDSAILGKGLVQIMSGSMEGISLFVYTKTQHQKDTKEMEFGSLQTQGPEYGHKGGVWARFSLLGRRFAFLTAHFTHADDNLHLRLEDFQKIENKTEEDRPEVDYKFWFGDLNFRLKDRNELTAEVIADRIDKGQESEVLDKDELKCSMKEGKAFQGYSEMQINFKPTYKFAIGTNNYDLTRRPAWTDRVLYRAAQGRDIRPLYYGSIPALKDSDHKPVEAFFRVSVEEHS